MKSSKKLRIKKTDVVYNDKNKTMKVIDLLVDENGKEVKTHIHEFFTRDFHPIKLIEARKKILR